RRRGRCRGLPAVAGRAPYERLGPGAGRRQHAGLGLVTATRSRASGCGVGGASQRRSGMNHTEHRKETFMQSSASTTLPAARQAAPQHKRALVAACIGNFIEYFDFVIYGYFAPVIALLFFPA